jgi:hypothetical protein
MLLCHDSLGGWKELQCSVATGSTQYGTEGGSVKEAAGTGGGGYGGT